MGLRPWFAFLFLRALFLRAFFAMVSSLLKPFCQGCHARRGGGAQPPYARPFRPGGVYLAGRSALHDWMHQAGGVTVRWTGECVVAEEIRAEMVANVLKVVAAEGDALSEGDTVVILESMKMEIPVLAEVGGNLSTMAVHEGDVVQGGDLIAVLS